MKRWGTTSAKDEYCKKLGGGGGGQALGCDGHTMVEILTHMHKCNKVGWTYGC